MIVVRRSAHVRPAIQGEAAGSTHKNISIATASSPLPATWSWHRPSPLSPASLTSSPLLPSSYLSLGRGPLPPHCYKHAEPVCWATVGLNRPQYFKEALAPLSDTHSLQHQPHNMTKNTNQQCLVLCLARPGTCNHISTADIGPNWQHPRDPGCHSTERRTARIRLGEEGARLVRQEDRREVV